MNISNLLPIGSVVLVKEASNKMMIIGILQENEGKRYDYMAVLYPEGYLSKDHIFLFNHEDIDKVDFLGFMGVEHQIFRNNLAKLVDQNEL